MALTTVYALTCYTVMTICVLYESGFVYLVLGAMLDLFVNAMSEIKLVYFVKCDFRCLLN